MLKKILNNRLYVSGICFFLAAVIAFGLIPAMYHSKGATTQIIVAAGDIKKGTQLTDPMLKNVEVGAYGLPLNLITDKAEIIGQYAAVDMKAGDYIMVSKLQEYRFDQVIDEIIQEGKRLVTVTVPTVASGLSSHLQKGDIVTVANFIPEKERFSSGGSIYEPSKVIMYPELMELTVYDVENAKTESADQVRAEGDKNGTGYDPIPKTVTFIATELQAVKLIEAEYNGKIHLILAGRSNS